jgi:hypothetical protein
MWPTSDEAIGLLKASFVPRLKDMPLLALIARLACDSDREKVARAAGREKAVERSRLPYRSEVRVRDDILRVAPLSSMARA